MICPRCGAEMTLDYHRRIPMNMCYQCGFMEGRSDDSSYNASSKTNFVHLKSLNLNETAAFISRTFSLDENEVRTWLEDTNIE